MLWLIALHIIAVVCWFAALFYLPRLFVYHSQCLAAQDQRGNERFQIMEKKLYRLIMTPAGMTATALGFTIIQSNPSYYWHQGWLHAKLTLVLLLWIFHWYCGKLVRLFREGQSPHGETFYRIFNEIPVIILVSTVFLVILKPF